MYQTVIRRLDEEENKNYYPQRHVVESACFHCAVTITTTLYSSAKLKVEPYLQDNLHRFMYKLSSCPVHLDRG